jgi:hypothetical protein
LDQKDEAFIKFHSDMKTSKIKPKMTDAPGSNVNELAKYAPTNMTGPQRI